MHTPRAIHQVVLYTSAALSLIGNCLLIFVVLHRKCTILGTYRWLLMAFAVMDIIVSLVHAYVLPVFVQVDYGLIVFSMDTYRLPSFYLVNLSLILPCQLYYGNLILPNYIRDRFARFAIFAIFINAIFTIAITFGQWLCDKSAVDHFFDDTLLTKYDIDLSSDDPPRMIHYLHSLNGSWNEYAIGAGGITALSISITLIVNLYCGWRIVRALNDLTHSEHSKRLQLQLFRSLIVQFSVPFLFCAIPFSVLVVPPLLGHTFGQAANLIGMLVSVFPAIDPYLILFSLPKFRRILGAWFRQCKTSNTVSVTETSL